MKLPSMKEMPSPAIAPADSEDELLDQVANEFLRGIDSRNPKMMREALHALVTNIQSQDAGQDEAEEEMPQ
jgi:hypothetical protein